MQFMLNFLTLIFAMMKARPTFIVFLTGLIFGPQISYAQSFSQVSPPSLNTPLSNPFSLPREHRNGKASLQNGLDFGTSVKLTALLSENSPLLTKNVVWRIYSERADEQQGLTLVTKTNDAQPQLRLPPGIYVINAAFGRATLTRRLQISNVPIQDHFILNAGGLILSGKVEKTSIPAPKLTATITTGPGTERTTVIENAKAGEIIRLPAGDYHVVSRYGDANAILAVDIVIKPGMVTEATLNHHAGQVVLKLVKEQGGEALANTAWSVLTPGGDTVKEVIGAFPSLVLQQGEYTAIARNEGRVFTTSFTVESGKDMELELPTQ
jgi:hypothetical protein